MHCRETAHPVPVANSAAYGPDRGVVRRPSTRHFVDLCLNSDRPVSTARRRCLLIHSMPASAAMNARFVQRASKTFCSTSALTVREALFRGQFGRRRIGRAPIISGKPRRAARSGIARSIQASMRCLPRPLEPFHLKSDSLLSMPTSHCNR